MVDTAWNTRFPPFNLNRHAILNDDGDEVDAEEVQPSVVS